MAVVSVIMYKIYTEGQLTLHIVHVMKHHEVYFVC